MDFSGILDRIKNLLTPKTISPLPDEVISPIPTGGTEISIPKPTPTFNDYETQTIPTFDQNNIPREVANGIYDAEGKTFNIGAVDSNPKNAKTFDSILAEATTAAKMFSGQAEPKFYGNGEAGRQQFADANKLDPVQQLIAIMNAGYAGDPNTWRDRSSATGGAGLNYPTWADYVQDTPGWKKWHGNY